jgi:phosphate acetyltransferase
MEYFLETVKNKARIIKKRIVFPESWEEKVLKACETIVKHGLAIPYLIGDRLEIEKNALKYGVSLSGVEVRDPKHDINLQKYINEYYNLRKKKGITLEQARSKILLNHYFAAMMIRMGDADGGVGGLNSDFKPFMPAFEIIGPKDELHKVSGVFFMVWEDGRLLFFADCSTIINPDAKDLANIAIDTAETAKKVGVIPKIAMLSFSTHNTAKDPSVSKMAEATKIVKSLRPDLMIEGEVQADVALVKEVAEKKLPGSLVQGDANILIFPDLDAGNIAYKLVERLARPKAIGPILQGLKKPFNDLSRGCSSDDIVNVAAITAVESEGSF